jgi:processive 1,2-diacylglycerol beta-glucosyltransferase
MGEGELQFKLQGRERVGMTPRRSIAILTFAPGEGDRRAADIIQRAIQDGEANFDIRVVDAWELSRAWFRRIHAAGVVGAMERAREWWARRVRGKTVRDSAWVPRRARRRGCREVFRRLRESPPDLVIAAGSAAAGLASLARRDGWISCPLLAVQTELEMAAGDDRCEVDVFAVANEASRAAMIAQGVSPHRVVLCGFPIDPAFSLPFDVEDLMPALGLDPRRPVVLVMGGSRGGKEALAILAQLERCVYPVQVVMVAGRDAATKVQIEALRGRVALDLEVFGWTEMVPELMAAADLMITRPAALPTAEALARGLPMILTVAGSEAEERLARDLQQAGAARRVARPEEIVGVVEALLGDREAHSRMSQHARELGRPAAAHAIAQMAVALLDTSSYIDFLATPPSRPGESAYLM